jgi:hypothetical protein
VVGSLTSEPDGKVVVEARVADVGTQQVQGGLTASATLEEILDAEKQLALRIFEQLGVNLTPAERRQVEQRATQNLAALLAYSRGVRFEVHGDYGQAGQQYEAAMRLDPSFALAGARLQSVRGGDGAAGGSLQRAAGVAANQVNAGFASPIGGVTDPAFRAPTVTIFIHVTTPP